MSRTLAGAVAMNPDGFMIQDATADDLPALRSFMAALSMTTRASRFFVPERELPPMLTQALRSRDPLHHFLVARAIAAPGSSDAPAGATPVGATRDLEGPIVGLAQYARCPFPSSTCEVAIVIADSWQRRGLGRELMLQLLADAKRQGLDLVIGEVLRQNRAMLAMARSLGFTLQRHPEDPMLVQIVRSIRDQSAAGMPITLRPPAWSTAATLGAR